MTKFRSILYSFAVSFSILSTCLAQNEASAIRLDWSHKVSDRNTGVVFKFVKARLVRDSLKLDVAAHNIHKNMYQCIFITAQEKSVHMDDEFGGEYRGATLSFKNGLDNKLALNQRKLFTITIPAPEDDISLVNMHFGLFAKAIRSEKNCDDPLKSSGYNFHQLDWDISQLRSK